MLKYLQTNKQIQELRSLEDENLGHSTMQATQTSRNARKGGRSLEKVMEERDDGYQLLPRDKQQQEPANLTNTSFSSVAKAVMGYGDLGDEMNLSLIHSFTCAKYSIIKVVHILYDLTFPDISSFQRSHILLGIKKKKKSLDFLFAQTQEFVFYQAALPKSSR